MISDKHNFRKNFSNATGVEDNEMALDVLLNQINEQILENKPAVIKALSASGVSVSRDPSNRKLAVLISENMGNNEGLQKNMMALILSREDNPYLHSDGGQADVVLSPEAVANLDILALQAGVVMKRAYENKVIPAQAIEMLQDKEKWLGYKTGMSILQKTFIWGGAAAAIIGVVYGISLLISSNKETSPAPTQ